MLPCDLASPPGVDLASQPGCDHTRLVLQGGHGYQDLHPFDPKFSSDFMVVADTVLACFAVCGSLQLLLGWILKITDTFFW